MKKYVFIVGSKGIPANYGGYETFVDNLTSKQKSTEIQYFVACKVTKKGQPDSFSYNGATCFNIYVPNIGSAQAIYYDIASLKWAINYVKSNKIESPIFYVLACRIGPFMASFTKKIHQLGGEVYVNPDGHEWLRAKWSKPVRKYWKESERLMVKHSDLLICDSISIENYIQTTYSKYAPKTNFIAYGAEVTFSKLTDTDPLLRDWLNEFHITGYQYYLIVGRFVPENNYETMIREFMASDSNKDLVIITNVEHNKFYEKLERTTHFSKDQRIKFVGTVYNDELLKKIRELAYGYLHGHSVGGTNPSLLEALASTRLNLLFDVGFNREVGRKSAFYWSSSPGSLCSLINEMDLMDTKKRRIIGDKASEEIVSRYSWSAIVGDYEALFLE